MSEMIGAIVGGDMRATWGEIDIEINADTKTAIETGSATSTVNVIGTLAMTIASSGDNICDNV